MFGRDYLTAISSARLLCVGMFFMSMLAVNVVGLGQGQSETYVLYKGGDLIPKKEIFLLLDSDSVRIIEEGKQKLFNYKGNYFKSDSSTFGGRQTDCADIPDTVCSSIAELYRIAELEIKKELDRVENEKGFRPPPPIRHVVLKLNLVLNRENECVVYEVDWI